MFSPGGPGLPGSICGLPSLFLGPPSRFQPIEETVGSVAGFLGLPASSFRLGRGSLGRPLGGFQAIPEALAPAPLASKRLLRALGSTVCLCESGRRHGRQPLVVGTEGAALGDDGLFGAICPAVRLRKSRLDYSHKPVMLCSKTGALGDFGLFGPIGPCLRSAAIRLRLIGPSTLGIPCRLSTVGAGLCNRRSLSQRCNGSLEPADNAGDITDVVTGVVMSVAAAWLGFCHRDRHSDCPIIATLTAPFVAEG